MAEATIDELQIEIESDGADAAQALEKLQQTLERLVAPVQALTTGNGLNKLTKQLEKLTEAGRAISSLSGLDKVTQAANALKSLDTLTGAPKVNSYVNAINKLSQASGAVQAIAAFPDVSAQLSSLTNALNSLRSIQDIRLTPLINSLSRLPAVVQAINSMPAIDTSRIEMLNSAMAAFRTENATAIRQLANALNRLPTVAQRINQIDFTQFSNSIRQLTTTLEPLMQRAEQAAQGLTALAQVMQAASRQSNNSGGLGGLGRTLGSLSTKSLISWASLLKLKKVLGDCFNVSARYVENLNLFNVTMGKSASSAFEFAEAVNAALGVDTSDWIRYQGFFQSVGKGFGVVSDKADLMSKNLTQLSYDISSFYNISTEEAYNKVQSGFAGELEPLRRLGFALDEATLKQLAYSKGITQSYESMTQAQKAQLRYVAMIEQAQNIGVTGDMSRTIDTASNGVRVLEARIQQFTRALGNMLMPVLSALLPYFTAFVQVLTEAANGIANFLGFELPKIDLSGVSNGYDDIAGAADEATAATEKFKGSLAGVDQLNIIGSHTNKSGSGTGYSTDLDIELPTYDFLNGVESKTKEIAENIRKWFKEALPWIEAVGTAIGGVFIGTKIHSFFTNLRNIGTTFRTLTTQLGPQAAGKLFGVAGGLTAGATSGVLLYNSLKNLAAGTGNLTNNLTQLRAGLTIAVGSIAAFAALGNPVGAAITAVVATVGAAIGVVAGLTEKVEMQNKAVTDSALYKNGGTKITDIANAFDNWATAASKVNKETVEKYDKINEYSRQISGLLDDMGKFAETDFDMTKLTAADAADLKKPFEELCGYLENDFQSRCQAVADDVKTIFANLGISGAIADEVTRGFSDLNTWFSDSLTQSQTIVSEALMKVSNGETLTEAEQSDMVKNYNLALDLARLDDPKYQAVEKLASSFDALDLSKIDLESDETVKEMLSQFDTSVTDYATSALNAYNAEIDNLDVLAKKTQILYDASDKSAEATRKYNEGMGYINLSKSLAYQSYENSMSDLWQKAKSVYDAVEHEYVQASGLVEPTPGGRYAAHLGANNMGYLPWSDEYKSFVQNYASGKWLENNEGYQTALANVQHLNQLTSSLEFDVPAPAEGTAARKIYDSLAAGGVLNTTMTANIQAVSTGVPTLDELIEKGLASCELKVAVVSEDNLENYSAVIPPAQFKAMSGQNQTGYAREAVSSAYSEAAANRAEEAAPQEINLYTTIEMGGEEVANVVNRVSSKEMTYSNGHGW